MATPADRSDAGGWGAMLKAIPVRNTAASVKRHADGMVVAVPNKKPDSRWPLSWLIRPPQEKELVLDAIGSAVWRLCDGERTVEQIVEAFARKYSLEFHESRIAVTGYIKSLVQRGALAIRVS